MLVAALGAAHDRLVRGSGVEPAFQRVGKLAIFLRVDPEVFIARLLPYLDAAALDL